MEVRRRLLRSPVHELVAAQARAGLALGDTEPLSDNLVRDLQFGHEPQDGTVLSVVLSWIRAGAGLHHLPPAW